MNTLHSLIQFCSIALFAAFCFFTPPQVSYIILAFLIIRIFIYLRPTKGQKIQNFDGTKTALLVVDMQEAMCGKKGTYHLNENLVEKVNAAIFQAEQQNQEILYICQKFHRYDFIFCLVAMGGCLMEGLKGTSLCRNLKMSGNKVFVKHQQDSFTSKNLNTYLKENQIGAISIVGLDAASCVYKTALGALNRGYHVTIMQNGVFTKRPDSLDKILQKLSIKGVEVISDN